MYTVKQRVLIDHLVWCVVDEKDSVTCYGSYVSCSNAARELNRNLPRLTQSDIDGKGEHRKGFAYTASQLSTTILGSLRKAW